MGKFPYSAPTPSVPDRLISDCIVPSLTWLRSNQNDDGSWGGDHILDRVVATCHATMALLSAGFLTSDAVLVKAARFLVSDRVTVHTWGFWRIAPLINIQDAQPMVLNDLDAVAQRITRRSGGPHPDQIMELFLMKMLMVLGRVDEAAQHSDAILRDFSPADGWFGRADTSTHAIAVLAALERPPVNMRAMTASTARIVKGQCVRHGPGLVSWGDRVSTTAYTIMNLLESPLRDRSPFRELAQEGAAWIASQRRPDGSWRPETPPYGGEGEIAHPAYFTSVALRGLLAYVDAGLNAKALIQSTYAQATADELQDKLAAQRRHNHALTRTNHRWRVAAGLTVLLAVVSSAVLLAYNYRSLFTSNWSSVSGIAILVLGAVIVLVFDLFDYSTRITQWARKRLASRKPDKN